MGDVFDLLLSIGDFETFKEIMLSYKRDSSQVRTEEGIRGL